MVVMHRSGKGQWLSWSGGGASGAQSKGKDMAKSKGKGKDGDGYDYKGKGKTGKGKGKTGKGKGKTGKGKEDIEETITIPFGAYMLDWVPPWGDRMETAEQILQLTDLVPAHMAAADLNPTQRIRRPGKS